LKPIQDGWRDADDTHYYHPLFNKASGDKKNIFIESVYYKIYKYLFTLLVLFLTINKILPKIIKYMYIKVFCSNIKAYVPPSVLNWFQDLNLQSNYGVRGPVINSLLLFIVMYMCMCVLAYPITALCGLVNKRKVFCSNIKAYEIKL
jgi:hypothetical protein